LGPACGESDNTLTIDVYKKEVVADDGFALSAFDLHLRGHPRDETPNVWMFYLVGSEPVFVLESIAQFAELVAMGFGVVLLQPRGVANDGTIDRDVFWQYDSRYRRVADLAAVMDAYLQNAGDIPVLLVGSSQGGVVAADLAAGDPRVTHLLMMASGGGWTQAEELTFCVEQQPGCVGMSSVEDLDAKFDEISAAPASGELWAGHPFRMWSSYLWFRPSDGLTSLSIPMFLAQGSEDIGIVQSSRALRDELARLGLTNLTYVEYPGLDHHFADADGESRLIDVQEDAYAWMVETGLLTEVP
jgi:pimeloyl-ACP methyl ester carboxylesterase